MSAAEDTARQDAWHSVETSFAALGRAVLILDAAYHVLQASYFLDTFVCEGTRDRLLGRSVSDLLGSRLFVPGDALHRALSQGHRAEGRRAFIKCPRTGAQLVSLSVAPLPGPDVRVLHDRARFIVVIRPADAPGLPNEMDDALLARSPGMLQIVSMVEALSESEATVLITGESGTGKEVVARAIHAHSPRASGPFVAVNTGAIPGPLLESELFGHVRGAFTGAVRDRRGSIELASGGTLFLDEIGEMSPELQVKLLRVVQEREYSRLGESDTREVDARIIAATHVDLERAVRERRFREDLYYRLRVVPIAIPPLRQRPEDIGPLAHHLLLRITSRAERALQLSPDALDVMMRYPWPGNVRQLENALEFAVALCQGQTLQVEHLPPEVRMDAPEPPDETEPRVKSEEPPPWPAVAPTPPPEGESDEATKLRSTLDAHRWNRQAVADALGISRTTLWRRMRALGLE
ncbi:MAG: sigma 54-interacting transcriptional regulator [Myxococcales bacterium]|nr:sigma 54-interacting transcriptional regulator [Myxococcales bacterium]MCB9580446.1 sigma 54-interacting transcriptional regulator [Polyangiaceae bacterium]